MRLSESDEQVLSDRHSMISSEGNHPAEAILIDRCEVHLVELIAHEVNGQCSVTAMWTLARRSVPKKRTWVRCSRSAWVRGTFEVGREGVGVGATE